jgi:heterodisulfide reductase subunit A
MICCATACARIEPQFGRDTAGRRELPAKRESKRRNEIVAKDVLVIGGGIAGIQASLDLADMGVQVRLVEKLPSIGGKMAQLDKTFPTNDCAI